MDFSLFNNIGSCLYFHTTRELFTSSFEKKYHTPMSCPSFYDLLHMVKLAFGTWENGSLLSPFYPHISTRSSWVQDRCKTQTTGSLQGWSHPMARLILNCLCLEATGLHKIDTRSYFYCMSMIRVKKSQLLVSILHSLSNVALAFCTFYECTKNAWA